MTLPMAVKADAKWYHCRDCGSDIDGEPQQTQKVEFCFEGTKEEFDELFWNDIEDSDQTQNVEFYNVVICGDCGEIEEDDFEQINVGDTVYQCSTCDDQHTNEDRAHECCE